MTFIQLYQTIQDQTFDTTATTLTYFKNRINEAIRFIIREAPGTYLNTVQTFSTVVNTQFYSLPSNYGDLYHVSALSSNTLYTLREAPTRAYWDNLNVTNTSSSYPAYYWVEGSQIGIWPRPSSVFTVNSHFRLKAPNLVNDADVAIVPDGHEDTIFNYVLWKHYQRIGEATTADRYKIDLNESLERLREDYGLQTTGIVLDYGDDDQQNINPYNYVQNITP